MSHDNLQVQCQIHYDGIDTEGSFHKVPDTQLKKLHINKSIRFKLGGENCHYPNVWMFQKNLIQNSYSQKAASFTYA